MKRIGGAPDVSAAGDGRTGPRLQPRPGPADRRGTCGRRRQRRPRAGARRRPARGRHRRRRTRLRLDPRRRRGDRGPVRRGAAGRGGRRHREALSRPTARASTNTDVAVQTIESPKSTLRRVDEAPYRRYVDAGGEMVMLSTAIFPAFSDRPAAFTRSIATGELRGRLGFEGVSITDALADRRRPGFRRPREDRDRRRPGRRRPPPLSRSGRRPPRPRSPRQGARIRRPLPPRVRGLGRPSPPPPPPARRLDPSPCWELFRCRFW